MSYSDATPSETFDSNTKLFPRLLNLGSPVVFSCRPPPSVTKAQLAKLQIIFENIDVSKSGTVYCSEILSVVDMAQSPFTDNLFKLVGEIRSPVDPVKATPLFASEGVGAHQSKMILRA